MRIGIVGTGGVALRHLGVLAQLPDVQLVGHVSHDLGRARVQAERWGGAAFADVHDLLARAQPEAVWICVAPDRHGPLEHALIDAGVPLFVEKPLAADLAPAESIAARLADARLITAVGYKFRALDTLPALRALLRETPPRLVLAAWHDALPSPSWWRHARQSGGQVVEQATHLLDLVRLLVGECTVVSAAAARWPRPDAPDADVPDVSTAALRVQTPDGPIPGVLTATCLLPGRQAIHLQLVCAGRVLTLTEQSLRVEAGRDEREIRTTVDPFQVEDEAFLAAVRASDPTLVLCTYAEALQTHRLACAIRAGST